MEKLKIRVTTEKESKEAQELFFELGYSWHGREKCYNRIGNYVFITAYPDEMLLRMGWGGDTNKEITLPQLKDMVVLNRNDIGDATHEDNGIQYFESSDYKLFLMNDESWIDVTGTIVRSPTFKPIEKEMKEYLNDKVASAEAARQGLKGIDNVNNPSHYNKGGVECIDAIQSSMTKEAFCGYLKGNIQKYVFLYENKGGVESLQKAQWYLNKLIEVEAS